MSTERNTFMSGLNITTENFTFNHSMFNTDSPYKWIYYARYYAVLVLIFGGLIGNLLSILVFTLTHLRQQSSSRYLAVISVADSVYLISVTLHHYNKYPTPTAICSLNFYLGHISSFLSVAFIVVFTIERYVVVRYPFKKQQWCSPKRANKVIAIICTPSFAIFSYWLWASGAEKYRLGPDRNDNNSIIRICAPRMRFKTFVEWAHYFDMLVSHVIPMIFIVIFNTKIIAAVLRIRSGRIRANSEQSSQVSLYNLHSAAHNRPRNAQMHVTRVLVIISTTFVALNFPQHLVRLYSYVKSHVQSNYSATRTEVCLQQTTQFIYLWHFAINFYLYNACSRTFQLALKHLLSKLRFQLIKIFCRKRRTFQDSHKPVLMRLRWNKVPTSKRNSSSVSRQLENALIPADRSGKDSWNSI